MRVRTAPAIRIAAETWRRSTHLAKGGFTILMLGALLDLTSHLPGVAATQLGALQSSSHLVMFVGMALTLTGILAGAARGSPAAQARRRGERRRTARSRNHF